VFLLRFGADLVPMGCFDAQRGQLLRGSDCLGLIAARPQVRVLQVEHDQQRERTSPVTAAPVNFIGSGQTVDGYRLDLPCPQSDEATSPCEGPGSAAGRFAVWPPAFGPVTLAARPEAAPEAASTAAGAGALQPLPREVIEDLGPRLRECRSGRLPTLTVHQRLRVDLDGDGTSEELITVRAEPIQADNWEDSLIRGPEAAGCLPSGVNRPGEWFFLYVRRGARFVRVPLGPLPADAPSAVGDTRPGFAAPSPDGEVLASFDLDGDGAFELWLQQPYYEGNNWAVVRSRGGVFEVIAHFAEGT
jgi:hypothetical protein